ncbi:MAG: NAD-dependent epimerase/dehydratase family protein [Candidatus Thermoplasmatota archaeon]|nr:NAD-dependent epimerase/dehydratase family protein [Candidatus Thermoplasmatota archaeon]
MDYLVAGGNGFIGSNLITHILSREPEANIINLDLQRREPMEDYMSISRHHGRYTFKEGDICELSTYEHYLKVSDVVINCASENDKGRFSEKMERFIKTNILGARVLADACVRNNVPLLHVSTDEVYGSCPFTVQRREEHTPIDPTNPYATTMAAGERLVAISGRRGGVPIAIVRTCEAIGPNQGLTRIVPRTIKMIRDGRPPWIPGKKGERYRDWLHVLDLCSAIGLVVRSITGNLRLNVSEDTHPEHNLPGRTVISGTSVATTSPPSPVKHPKQIMSGVSYFNITAEMSHDLNAIVETILSLMGSELPVQDRMDEGYLDLGYNASGKKLNYHGWQAKFTDIREVLRSTIEWYEEHPEITDSIPSGRLGP